VTRRRPFPAWVRVLLLIRFHHIDDVGPRGMAAGEARAASGPGDAPADRAGGVVELIRAHEPVAAAGTAQAATPWRAVQLSENR
jgi:hypothetical protein